MNRSKPAWQAYLSRAAAGAAIGAILGFCVWLFSGSRETIRIGPLRLSDETIKNWLPTAERRAPLLIGFGLVAGASSGLGVEWFHRRRVAQMTDVAGAMGCEYQEEADEEARVTFSQRLSGTKKVAHLFVGVSEDGPFQVADVTEQKESAGSNVAPVHRTVCSLPVDGLPDFLLVPRRWVDHLTDLMMGRSVTLQGTKRSDAAEQEAVRHFARRWIAMPGRAGEGMSMGKGDSDANRLALEKLMNIELIKFLIPQVGYSILVQDGRLLVWKGQRFQSPASRRTLIDSSVAIRQKLLEANGAPSNAPFPVEVTKLAADRGRLALYMQFGAILGAFLGFTLGGVLGMSWVVLQSNERGHYDFVIFFALPFTGMLLGVLPGALLACKLGARKSVAK